MTMQMRLPHKRSNKHGLLHSQLYAVRNVFRILPDEATHLTLHASALLLAHGEACIAWSADAMAGLFHVLHM